MIMIMKTIKIIIIIIIGVPYLEESLCDRLTWPRTSELHAVYLTGVQTGKCGTQWLVLSEGVYTKYLLRRAEYITMSEDCHVWMWALQNSTPISAFRDPLSASFKSLLTLDLWTDRVFALSGTEECPIKWPIDPQGPCESRPLWSSLHVSIMDINLMLDLPMTFQGKTERHMVNRSDWLGIVHRYGVLRLWKHSFTTTMV
jgi:hypothetical protein